MAIKAVSQLNRFDNGGTYGTFSISECNLHMLSGDTLTEEDIKLQCASNWRKFGDDKWTPQTQYGKTYWNSLIEISKPINPPKEREGDSSIEYESQSITYQQLIENIVWDVKSFLNARNNLSNFDFLSVITDDYTFTGDKTFINNVTVKGNTYLGDNVTDDRVIIRAAVTNHGTLTQNGTSQFNDDVTVKGNTYLGDNVTDDRVIISAAVTNHGALTQNKKSYFNNDAMFSNYVKTQQLSVYTSAVTHCNIIGESRDIVFDGWSFGLVDRTTNKTDTSPDKTILSGGTIQFSPTYVGTYGTTRSSIDISLIGSTSLSGQSNRTGDPVCFVRGRPWELTAVNYAMSAYNLVNKATGVAWNVGNGTYRSDTGDDNTVQNTQLYSAVYFKNGKPFTTNVIEYAEHAYWSDLGERYLADDVYEPGTLVKFGGEKEITIANDEVNAIVSTKAFDLNAGLVGGTVIALCGRVPTKVKGKIEKFDKIMLSDIPGVACKWDGASRVIGRALESNNDENIKLVECVTRFEI